MKTLKGAVYGSHAYNIVMECILCFTTTSSNFLHIAGYCMMSWQTRGGGFIECGSECIPCVNS